MNSTQELYELCRKKLLVLQKARIVETDPSQKFKLQQEIEETRTQCEEFASQLLEVKEGYLYLDGKLEYVPTENSDASRTQTESVQNRDTKKLMCLINRHDQLKNLRNTIEQYRERQNNFVKPLFCVTYGHKEECFDKFLERIEADKIGKVIHLDPITPKAVSENITLDELIIFYQFYDSETVSERDVQRILNGFFTKWKGLGHDQRNHPVLFFVFLRYGFTKTWWQFLKLGNWREYLNKPEKLVALVETLSGQHKVNTFILPELEPIAFVDVERWFLKYYYGKTFPAHTIQEKIYTKNQKVSLYSLIEKLKPLLDSQG